MAFDLEKLLREEDELEQKMFTRTPEDTEAKVPEAPAVEPTVPADEKEVGPSDVSKPEEDWKKRYTNLRASRDEKLWKTQSDLADAKRQIATLQHDLQALRSATPVVKEDIFKDLFTAEEEEALGETAITAMKKAAEKAASSKTASMEKELAEERLRRVKEANDKAQAESANAYNLFLNRLARAVPDYEDVDKDPAFMDYMGQTDIDGSVRADNFKKAEANGDVASIARYMIDFKSSKVKQPVSPLEDLITPTGNDKTTNSSTEKKPKGMSMKDVDDHYKKYIRGYYNTRQKEYDEMEKRIDEAASLGLITR